MGLNDLVLLLLADSHECTHRQNEKQLEAMERLKKAVKVLTNMVGIGFLTVVFALSWVLGSVARNDRAYTVAAVLLLATIGISLYWTLYVVFGWIERNVRKMVQEYRRRRKYKRMRKEFLDFTHGLMNDIMEAKEKDEAKKKSATDADTAGAETSTGTPSSSI